MKMNWIGLSVIALISLSVMTILITTLTRKGYPTPFVLLGVGVAFTIFYSLQTFVFQSYSPKFNIGIILILILIGALSTIGNLMLFNAAKDAPNPGLAIAIGAGMQSGIVALLAFMFFKDRLTPIQLLGIALSIIAVFLINIGSNTKMGNQNASSEKVIKIKK